ncbi:hypothetical protein GJV85_02175 [Sulfurimonas aquatica]|uniref:Uncharacterized protein n=1 Tax=Sulfurimonas aquatica TaxID=2672570 RepID=A0A975AYK8_9BACT|nr:hypothetical protein [Sulfurimonas aquatica]QSZ40969.1 hypothetical protein GJV85_02175 [Sulfurimonas aquatica]
MKTILLSLIITTSLFSAPAFTKERELKNADGTTFMAKAQGNQHLNWLITQDGEILKYNQKSKNFEYAKIEKNELKASGVKYEKNNSKRARAIGRVNKLNHQELYKLWGEKQKLHRSKFKH